MTAQILGALASIITFVFVFWLLRRKYRDIELPPPVTEALDEARRAYLAGFWPNLAIIVLLFVIALT